MYYSVTFQARGKRLSIFSLSFFAYFVHRLRYEAAIRGPLGNWLCKYFIPLFSRLIISRLKIYFPICLFCVRMCVPLYLLSLFYSFQVSTSMMNGLLNMSSKNERHTITLSLYTQYIYNAPLLAKFPLAHYRIYRLIVLGILLYPPSQDY